MPPAPPIKFMRAEFRGDSVNYRLGHILLKLNDHGGGPQDVSAIIDDVLQDALGNVNFHLVSKPRGRWAYVRFERPFPDIQDLIRILSQDARVQFAEPDLMMVGSLDDPIPPGDPYLEAGNDFHQWGLDYINLPEVWINQTGNESVLIGLVDSGVLLKGNENNSPGQGQPLVNEENGENLVNHVDLDGSRFLAGFNYIENDPLVAWPHDQHPYFHGTTMAGIMAAWENNKNDSGEYLGTAGVNWGSDVYVCRALDNNNFGTVGLVNSAVNEILEFVAESSKKVVINLSINQRDDTDLETWELLFANIVEAGAIVCLSAGNIIKSTSGDPVTVYQPARMAVENNDFASHVIVVGAFGIDEESQKPFLYENTGEVIEDMVFSPGVKVATTTNDGWTKGYGTSIANAHVSGLAALLWSEDINLPATKIVQSIKDTCVKPIETHIASEAELFSVSYGIINALAAYQAILDTPGTPGQPGQPVLTPG